MTWPLHIRGISLPSLVFCTLFLWNGFVYLVVFRILNTTRIEQKKFLYFGLTSIALAWYSYSTFNLYSSEVFETASGWQGMQFVALVFLFIFFALFCTSYLNLNHWYWNTLLPVITLLFLPFIFRKDLFLTENPAPKVFILLGHHTRILEVEFGPLAYVFIVWCFANLSYLALCWIKFQKRHLGKFSLPFPFLIFGLAAINDTLVATQVYRFYYLLELGFLGYIFSMGFSLFSKYVEANKQLLKKTEEVEALNEEMQFLLSSISHDLTAPLVSIRGFIKLLQETDEKEDVDRVHYLERIQINSDHMTQMLEGITAFLRIGRVVVKIEPVDLHHVVQEVMAILGDARERPNTVIELPKKWPKFNSSVNGVKQILLNLFQNALKYSHPDKHYVKLAVVEQDMGIIMTVEDEGPGISLEMKEKIFNPFFRLHSQTPGAGMGLAIVRKTAENLGGRVWLDPDYVLGSRFCVFLPDK